MEHLTYISHQSYLFQGHRRRTTCRMADPNASDDAAVAGAGAGEAWPASCRSEQGLDTPLLEKGANLSGGQRQRLALARALLHDSPVYIFDEATSNIDVESENDIMAQIHALAKTKTVILISHRLANVTQADHHLRAGQTASRRGKRHATQRCSSRSGAYARAVEHPADPGNTIRRGGDGMKETKRISGDGRGSSAW